MRVALCHGTFDCLHLGHVRHLQKARQLADYLLVTITADRHIRKGRGRPLFSENERREMLLALQCVGSCEILDEPTAVSGILKWRPAIYCKGSDYAGNDPSGRLDLERKAIESVGGKLIIIPEGKRFSSTQIITGEMLKERVAQCQR